MHILDSIPLAKSGREVVPYALVLRVDYLEGEGETYLLPLATAWGAEAERLAETARQPAIIASLNHPQTHESGIVYDAATDPAAAAALVDLIAQRRRLKGSGGELQGWLASPAAALAGITSEPSSTATVRVESNYSCVTFGDRAVLKVFRRLESGVNPDFEISRFLNGNGTRFPHTLPLHGAVEYRPVDGERTTVAVLHGSTPNYVTGWQFVQDALGRFFESVMTQPADAAESMALPPHASLWELASGDAPQLAKDLLGAVLEWAGLLGRRTAELHAALASDRTDPAFAPEPFTQLYQRSLYQSWRKRALQALDHLRRQRKSLAPHELPMADAVLENEKQVLDAFRAVVGQTLAGQRIRCHGDLNLNHVLYTGKDFLIVDFEGKASQSIVSRRTKRSVTVDLAAMCHSFQRAATQALLLLPTVAVATPETIAAWQQAARFWHAWSSSAFLRSYAAVAASNDLLPSDRGDLDTLLRFHLMAEALDELDAVLTDGGQGAAVPLELILERLGN